MSWKLAELRWRQRAGLNQRCPERGPDPGASEELEDMKSFGLRYTIHGRSSIFPRQVGVHTSPDTSIMDKVLPDAMPIALSPAVSDTSTTPLLKTAIGVSKYQTNPSCPLSPRGHDAAEPELSPYLTRTARQHPSIQSEPVRSSRSQDIRNTNGSPKSG
jgi:hypothetical protein